MRQLRDQLGLAEKHLHVRARRDELGQQPLDDDDLLEPGLAGESREMDRRHAAGGEQPDQLVTAQPLCRLLLGLVRQPAGTMPRNGRHRLGVLAIAFGLGSCVFDASYQAGQTTCNDGRCPSGMVCDALHVCVAPGHDAAIDAAAVVVDAPHVAALTCDDPGELASGVGVMGTTAGRSDTVSASCDGSIMNGPDAIFAIAITAAQSLHVSVAGSGALDAYVLASCELVPATPACVGDVYAATAPITASPVRPARTTSSSIARSPLARARTA